jgi:arylsulfatase A-like enzyme
MKFSLTFSAGALAAMTLFSSCGKAAAVTSKFAGNVILIVADDLGYGDLGCYGQRRIHTPNLDRMAAEGVRFTQAYAGSSVCSPSRCSLFTGLHTGHSAIRGNSPVIPLPESSFTLGSLMRKAGYATALMGKWDLGEIGTSGAPMRQGFDSFFGYDNLVAAHNYWPDFLWRNAEKVPLPNKVHKIQPYYSTTPGGVAYEKKAYAPEVIETEVMRFVEEHKTAPFFLAWTPTFPHANNEADGNGMEVPDAGRYSAENWPDAEKNYAAMVTMLDAEVGRLLDYLKRNALAENTLVLFVSDNGPHREGGVGPEFFTSSGPCRGLKRDLYEGGIRVPMIAWGGPSAQGRVVDAPVALWDILATLSAMTGVRAPENDGVPLPLTADAAIPGERVFYWEMNEAPVSRAVRKGPWKLLDFPSEGRVELYNIENDGGEADDVSSSHPTMVEELRAMMDAERLPSPFWDFARASGKTGD